MTRQILVNQFQKKDSNFASIILLFALIVGGALVYESNYSNLSIFAVVLILVVYSAAKASTSIVQKENLKVIRAFIFATIFLVLVIPLSSNYIQGGARVVQYIACFLAFFAGSVISLRKNAVVCIKSIVYIFTVASFVYWFATGAKLTNYSFFFRNANTYSCVLLCQFGFLSILSKMHKTRFLDLAILLIIAVLTFFTNSRAAFLSIVLYILAFVILNHRYRKKKNNVFLSALMFGGVLLFVVGFTYIYPQLFSTPLGNALQEFSLEHFDKLFFSGRNVIWSQLIEAIHEKPLFGYGLDATPSSIYNTVLSSHNLYLQTILQVGFVGFVLIFAPLFCAAVKMIKSRNISTVSISSFCFLLVVLFHECFEVSLTQNFLVCGLQMWFIIGVGCNRFATSISDGRAEKTKR
jgi:O-antigen ligase